MSSPVEKIGMVAPAELPPTAMTAVQPIGATNMEVVAPMTFSGIAVQVGMLPETITPSYVVLPESVRLSEPTTVAEVAQTVTDTPHNHIEITGGSTHDVGGVIQSTVMPVLKAGGEVIVLDFSPEDSSKGLYEAAQADAAIGTAQWTGNAAGWLDHVYDPRAWAEAFVGSIPAQSDPTNGGTQDTSFEVRTVTNLVHELGAPHPADKTKVIPPPIETVRSGLAAIADIPVVDENPEYALGTTKKNAVRRLVPDTARERWQEVARLFGHADHFVAGGSSGDSALTGDREFQLLKIKVPLRGRDTQRDAELLARSVTSSIGADAALGSPNTVVVVGAHRLTPDTRKLMLDSLHESGVSVVNVRGSNLDDTELREVGEADLLAVPRIRDHAAAQRVSAIAGTRKGPELASVAYNTGRHEDKQETTTRGNNKGGSENHDPGGNTSGSTQTGSHRDVAEGTTTGINSGETRTENYVDKPVVRPEELQDLNAGEVALISGGQVMIMDMFENTSIAGPPLIAQARAITPEMQGFPVNPAIQDQAPKTPWLINPIQRIRENKGAEEAEYTYWQQRYQVEAAVLKEMSAHIDPRYFFSGLDLRLPTELMLSDDLRRSLAAVTQLSNVEDMHQAYRTVASNAGLTPEQLRERVQTDHAIIQFAALPADSQHRVLERFAERARISSEMAPRIARDQTVAAERYHASRNGHGPTLVHLPQS